MSTDQAPAAHEAATHRNTMLEVSPAFSNLGSTTATRSWVALGAVILVLLAAAAWGLFGSVTLQQTVGAISVSNGLTYEVATPKAGIITRLAPVQRLYDEGDTIATVRPDDGGADVDIIAPGSLLITGWETILGSPVTRDIAIGRGVLVGLKPTLAGLTTNDEVLAISFVPLSDYQVLTDALALEVAVLNLGGDPKSYPATMVSFSPYPTSEARIAQITGNSTLAANIMNDTGGEAYMVALGFADSQDAQTVARETSSGDVNQITSGQAASLIITKVSSNPLRVLFGSGA